MPTRPAASRSAPYSSSSAEATFTPAERVVLVVTGTGLKPYGYDVDYSPQEVTERRR